ncbi:MULTISPECIES: hypothetical protein [Sphingomonas]|uniref:Uncharacterized protein n=2 Tax=Sphingomonas TaxID=13687 RepID=A0A7W9BQI1_9SPHN|nr:hypothetical protein [Sphingomonas prati]MBB5728301.1 hypothetical protein [Sphingomonas prati]GGE74909.1 hypothetical protein GCM10011404_04270 [Sphingomonas prati]
MSTVEDYSAKAAESLAAAEAATSERDRAFHRRAYSIYRKLVANVGEAEARAAERVPARVEAAKRAAAASALRQR